MLRAEDLMIGDWIFMNGHKVRVTKLTAGKEYNDCEGIPLTTEILENCGYKDIDSDPDGCDGYDIYFRSGDGWGINVNDFKLHYVHELQHALRLCGLNELAENFKIE